MGTLVPVDSVRLPSRQTFGGGCDEDSNWIVRASPRTNDGRTRPHRRSVVREHVVPSALDHFDYVGPDGAGRRIHSAWNGPGGAAIQPAASLLPSGGNAHAIVGL